ncbi:hypothetical protein BH11PSE2_BH11PSE2_11410 [soil metagenome]
MAAETLLSGLIGANLAGGAAVALVLGLRPVVRRFAGSRAAYGLWLIPPLAALATLLPARRMMVPASDTVFVFNGVFVPPPEAFDWRGAALAIWLIGAAIALLHLAVTHCSAIRRLGRMTREGQGLVRTESSAIGPAVMGLFSPRIIVPADFEARFDADERKVVLAHEQAHLTGGHLAAKTAAQVLARLNWFNPLAHLAVAKLAVDQELACDESVIESHPSERKSYARALLKTQADFALPLGCYWPSRSARLLKARVRLVSGEAKGARARAAGLAIVALAAIGAGAAAWAAQPPRPVSEPALIFKAPTPRGGDASRFPGGRQLLASAVPSDPEGNPMRPKTPARHLAAASAVAAALGLGTGYAAAEPQSLTNSRPPAAATAPSADGVQTIDAGDGRVIVMKIRHKGEEGDDALEYLALPSGDKVLKRIECRKVDGAADTVCTVSVNGSAPMPLSAEDMKIIHLAPPGASGSTSERIVRILRSPGE